MAIDRNTQTTRRALFGAAIATPAAAMGTAAHADRRNLSQFDAVQLRGTVNAAEEGLVAGASDDQSRTLQAVLDRAAEQDKPVFLPPGLYVISNVTLPRRTRLMGVPGATRLVYSGAGHFLLSENASHVELTGLILDGQNRAINEYAAAALRISSAEHAVVDNCQIVGSLSSGIQIDRSAGRIERSTISGAMGLCGIYALENNRLSIVNNTVERCSNGGILVHRWQAGEDGTMVTGNRVSGIGAVDGGTGQNGNGINVFRAASVVIANNHISDCDFSAIRSNAGDNVQIVGNHCLRSGETAIYSEFGFKGALINANIVDGGARGISIANFMQGGRMAVCSNNLVRNIHDIAPYEDPDHGFGTGIGVEADTTVTGNVVENVTNFGLTLGWGPYLRDVVVNANIIRDARTGIYVSVVDGAASTMIAGNVISGMREGAIIGYRWHDPVTRDMGSGKTYGYNHLNIEQNRVG